MPEAIIDVPLHETTRERYLNYALSVITSRALPDVRDGLKPVQRRILYAMFHNLHLLPDQKFRKSAAVVGDVMAKYHPHGDQSIYDAMVRMAQAFSLRYPLVDGQGNFGSVDGDGAAAMRYTESRLQHLAVELLEELKKETVDMRPNYDGTIDEPVVLPAQVPNLLVNGATGIAVGMATNIPPHNIDEVIRACIRLIDEPETTLEEIAGPIIRGPDFPTGGEILNDVESIREIYRNGRGAIELRGSWRVENEHRKKWLIVDSIPYGLNKSTLIGDIAEHIRKGHIPLIVDVRDESTEDVRVVMELKRGASPEAAMAWLFKRTPLASRFNVNLTALCPVDGGAVCQPRRVTLMELLREFLDFRLDVVVRRLSFDLRALEKRIHILEGFEILFDALDEAIRLIRESEGKTDARDKLMVRFEIDWEQAEAILETKLYRLAKLEIDEIRRELAEKRAAAHEIRVVLASKELQWQLIRDELEELREAYGDARRTSITGPVQEKSFSEETYIIQEDTYVIVTRGGWFKRQRSYTDLAAIRVREGDEVGWVVPSDSRESIVLFSDRGKAYTMRTADVGLTTGYGEPIQTRFGFADGEKVIGVAATDKRVLPPLGDEFLATLTLDDPTPPYVLAITRAGKGMRMSLDPFEDPSTVSGRTYMRLDPKFPGGDAVMAAYVSDGAELVSLATRQGKALVFAVSELNVLVNPGKGVMAIKLDKGDAVLGFRLVSERMDGLEVTTNRGRTEVVRPNKFKPTGRAGKGRSVITKGRLDAVVLPAIEWRFPEFEDDEPELDADAAELDGDEDDGETTVDAGGRKVRRPTTIAQLAAEAGVVVEPDPEPTAEPVKPTAAPIARVRSARLEKPAKPAPAPVTPAPEPVTPAPEPVTPAPEPATAAPEPVTPAPEPVTSAPEPATAAPEPVTSAPEPIQRAQTPVEPPAEPVKRKPSRKAAPAKAAAPVDDIRITAPIAPKAKADRSIKPKGEPLDVEAQRDTLGKIARIAVQRYKKRATKPPDDDPNQGNLF